MSLTREDFTDIKKELDDRYVLQSDCNDKQDAVNKKFSSDDKRIAIISHDFATIKKLMWTVASSSIGSLVVAFFEFIFK